jgi:hypothetical protein
MPQPISFDEIASVQKPAGSAITFDDVYAQREVQSRPGGRLDATPGEEPRPGQGLPGSPNYQPPTIAPAIKPAENANFGAALKSELVEDQGTRIRLVAESLGVDPKRVGIVDDKPVFVNDKGELQFVSGLGTRTAAAVVGNAPEAIGGTVGTFTGSPVIGSAAGAVGARGIKRAIAGAIFDEPQTIGGNVRDLATEGALNLGAGIAGKGATKVLDRGKMVDFSPTNRAAAEAARLRVKQNTGIDLDLAQASGDRKLISLRAYSARYPGKSAELIQAADEAAEGQFEAATNRVLDMIATSRPEEVAGSAGVRAADMAIAAVKAKRDAAVKPFYDTARGVVLGADVVEQLSSDPLVKRAALRVTRDPVYQRKLQGLPENSVGYWQQVKRNLDASYEQAIGKGNKTAAGEYADAAKQLNEKIAAASPEYKLANEHYSKVTREMVEPLENSVVGVLAKIKDPKAATAAAKIFQDPNVTPTQIAQARSVIAKQDPEAWNGLVRQWLGQAFNRAMKETQTADVVNPAGKFRQAVFGTPRDRAKAQAMLPQGAAKDFEELMFAVEKLASTPIAGSNTMRDTEIKDQLKGTGAVVFQWLTSPRKAVVDAAEQRALEQGTVAITEALLDPAKRSQLRRVVKMKPSTRQAVLISSIIGGQAATKAAADEFSVDRMPPSLEKTGQ